MKVIFGKRRILFYGCAVLIGSVLIAWMVWQYSKDKIQLSAFETVWAKSNDLRIRASEQAVVDFNVVRTVMRYYACRDFDRFFDNIFFTDARLESATRRATLRVRERKMPDVDCSTEIRVLGYSAPPVRFVRLIAMMNLPDEEAKQLANLIDMVEGEIHPREHEIWKKFAFVEVSIGQYILLTVWYYDGSRSWLTTFMERQDAEMYLQSSGAQRLAPPSSED